MFVSFDAYQSVLVNSDPFSVRELPNRVTECETKLLSL